MSTCSVRFAVIEAGSRPVREMDPVVTSLGGPSTLKELTGAGQLGVVLIARVGSEVGVGDRLSG